MSRVSLRRCRRGDPAKPPGRRPGGRSAPTMASVPAAMPLARPAPSAPRSCTAVSLTCLASNSSMRVSPRMTALHDGRGDSFHDVAHVAARHHTGIERLQRRLHRAAAVVPQHGDQRHVQHRDRVFDRAEHCGIDDVARGAHDEHVAKPLIEDDLGGDAAVRAAEHHGGRLLPRGQPGPVRDALARVLRACLRRNARYPP